MLADSVHSVKFHDICDVNHINDDIYPYYAIYRVKSPVFTAVGSYICAIYGYIWPFIWYIYHILCHLWVNGTTIADLCCKLDVFPQLGK